MGFPEDLVERSGIPLKVLPVQHYCSPTLEGESIRTSIIPINIILYRYTPFIPHYLICIIIVIIIIIIN